MSEPTVALIHTSLGEYRSTVERVVARIYQGDPRDDTPSPADEAALQELVHLKRRMHVQGWSIDQAAPYEAKLLELARARRAAHQSVAVTVGELVAQLVQLDPALPIDMVVAGRRGSIDSITAPSSIDRSGVTR